MQGDEIKWKAHFLPVNDSGLVQMVDREGKLAHILAHLALGKRAVRDDVVQYLWMSVTT